MTTQVNPADDFTAAALAADPQLTAAEAELRYYTAEEVIEIFKLPVHPRWLKKGAYERRFPHSDAGKKIRFLLRHMRVIADLIEVPALATGNRRSA